ncbi:MULTISPECIES: hypothetical protein, partial [unclassified Caballeronia]|uniref:hypothetical protein n=1 Tax=unclassified Caballeronia TaxID=2646786 RepID=UPI00285BD4E8
MEQMRAERLSELQIQVTNPVDRRPALGELNVLVTGPGRSSDFDGEIRALPPTMRDRLSDSSVATTPGGAVLGLGYEVAESVGRMAALFNTYNINPVTGERLSPGQVQRAKEDLVINVGTLGIGGGSQIAGQSIGRVARTAAESFG